jgi:hypothetical protein
MSIPAREPTQTDLEQRIAQARTTLDAAETQDARREAYEELRWLIAQRPQ